MQDIILRAFELLWYAPRYHNIWDENFIDHWLFKCLFHVWHWFFGYTIQLFHRKILHRSRKRWIIVSRVANNMNVHLNKVEFIPLFATNEMKMKYVWAWQQHQHKWNYKSYFLDVSFFLLVLSIAISLFLDIIIMLINVCSISRSA